MLLRLFILLTIVPLIEVVLLFRIAEVIDWGPTLALIIVTGILGAWLARREGLRTLGRIQADLNAGVVPTDSMLDGALILVAGVLLVTPGVLTDLCGFTLLVPPARRWVKRRLAEFAKTRIVRIDQGGPSPFVDVEATGRDADEGDDHVDGTANRIEGPCPSAESTDRIEQ